MNCNQVHMHKQLQSKREKREENMKTKTRMPFICDVFLDLLLEIFETPKLTPVHALGAHGAYGAWWNEMRIVNS